MQTDLTNKISILADLYANYQDDSEFREFMEFNDIGLPLAYFVNEKLAVETDAGTRFMEESFDLLLSALGIEDTGFEYLDEVLTKAALEGQ